MRRLLVLAALLFALPAHARTFYVDSEVDAVDALPGDGICATALGACTLRAAIQEANARPGEDTIEVPAGDFVLAIPGSDVCRAEQTYGLAARDWAMGEILSVPHQCNHLGGVAFCQESPVRRLDGAFRYSPYGLHEDVMDSL